MTEIRELRLEERYVVKEALGGSFGAAAIRVLDISQQGMQIEHPQPLRLATRSRLWFKRGDVAVSVHGVVIWSRLSKSPNDEGKLLYRSGIRLEANGDDLTSA
ncbi:MAG: PilZ domain-containing protein, partial [Thermoanaerobaculia bacterium]